jgi:hypothetical protein
MDGAPEIINGSPSDGFETNSQNTRTMIRRRARMISICLECRRRKIKCDKNYPCSNCDKFSRECLFLAPAMEMMARQRNNSVRLASISESQQTSIPALSTSLEEATSKQPLFGPSTGSAESIEQDFDLSKIEHYLEPAPLSIVNVPYGWSADEPSPDLGVFVGKMWMTDRVGGLFRPNMVQEASRTSLCDQLPC